MLTRLTKNGYRSFFLATYHKKMAITPGQIVVFYDGDNVLGSGVIDLPDSCQSTPNTVPI